MGKEDRKPLFVIIDGNAIIHRAYHALPPLTTNDGTMVNAVYGFTSMLLKVMSDLHPTHIAVSFDVAGKTFRDERYEKYKAKRVKADQALYDQIPLVYEVVEGFGIPVYTKQGFEADDVIGTITQKTKSQGAEVDIVIVTGDMDMLQLVDDGVRVYELRKGLSDIVIFDRQKVKARYGFGPELVPDYKGLRGDPSDNLPGIKGIGEKTATELLQKFGTIDELYRMIKNKRAEIERQVKPAVFKKLVDGEGDARLSRELATIQREVPDINFFLEDCAVRTIDRQKMVKIFQRFEFPSLLKRLPTDGDVSPRTPSLPKKAKRRASPPRNVGGEVFAAWYRRIEEETMIVVRELSSSQDVFSADFIGILVAAAGETVYVALQDLDSTQQQLFFSLFTEDKRLVVGHDLKQLIKLLHYRGVQTQTRLFDVMVAAYMLNAGTRTYDLAQLSLKELGKELDDGRQESLFGKDLVLMKEEVASIEALYPLYARMLEGREDLGLFEKVEMKLIPVLADIELAGVAVDTKLLKTLSQDIARDIGSITKKIWKEAGVKFNVASSTQLREVLFETMGLPTQGVKKGKTGLSTAASELEKLRGIHPVIEMIEEHRELAKLQNTYVDVLPTLINKKTGRVHTTFNQVVAATGRLSSTDPNLQNIPIRTQLGREIRNAFVAEPGNLLITADYAQIELRIVASLAQDEKMMEIFREGKDIHQATAAAINGVPLEKVTKEMRYGAKAVNFGVLYGMGAYGLSSRTGISQSEAQEFIRKYFEQFSGVKTYIDQTIAFAKKEGYVETLFGRRRSIPELQSDNYQLRNAGERMAVNMPIQGTQADLIKMAMIEVDEMLETRNWKQREARMILQVHDELVFEVKEDLVKEVEKLVKDAMEQVTKLRVPIEVHVAHGMRWGELK